MTAEKDGAANGGGLRVLHVVTTAQRRGAELFAFDLIRALRSYGVDQSVAVLRGLAPRAIAYEAETEFLPSNGRSLPGLRMDAHTLRSLRQLVQRRSPQIVHAHGSEALKYSVLALRGRRTPLLYRRITQAQPAATHGLRRIFHGRLMRRPDRVVTVAEWVRRETVDVFRVPADRVVTVPRGIDIRRLDPTKGRQQTRTELGIPDDHGVVISLGALAWEKDPVAHVDVMARVVRERPKTIHLMAGDGPLRPEVEDAVRRHGLEANVRVLGNRSDVADLLAASDVMILASRSEGMPGCLIEAGLAGLPVVAYEIAGSPEVVVDGTTGYVVPHGDVDRLASRVIQLLADEVTRRNMGEAARRRCRASFDINEVAPRFLAIYQELAE